MDDIVDHNQLFKNLEKKTPRCLFFDFKSNLVDNIQFTNKNK